MPKGKATYAPPEWSAEDSRLLLNWLSTRVDETGRRCHPDHAHERRAVERALGLARAHKLKVEAGVYLPRPDAPKGAGRRGKPGARKVA
jgi:hypothetical protein